MKKIIPFLVVFMLSGFCFEAYSVDEARSTSEGTSCFYKFKYGVEAGLTLFNLQTKYNGEVNNDNVNSRAGFHVAATALYTITSAMFVLTMLDFAMKGSNYKYTSGGYTDLYKIQLFYLQLPILFAYNIAVIQAYTISALVGPYFAVGLGGKNKWEYTYDGQTESGSEKVKYGKENDFRRADYGAIIGFMVMRELFSFRVAYQLGLKNIHPTGANDASEKNRGFNFTVGYRFNCGG